MPLSLRNGVRGILLWLLLLIIRRVASISLTKKFFIIHTSDAVISRKLIRLQFLSTYPSRDGFFVHTEFISYSCIPDRAKTHNYGYAQELKPILYRFCWLILLSVRPNMLNDANPTPPKPTESGLRSLPK